MWRGELPCAYYNSNLLRFEFDANHICSNAYANLTLNTKGSVSRLRALATGTTSVAAIYTRDLLNFLVAVPPLPEQQAIAAALSDADELIGSLEQLLTKSVRSSREPCKNSSPAKNASQASRANGK